MFKVTNLPSDIQGEIAKYFSFEELLYITETIKSIKFLNEIFMKIKDGILEKYYLRELEVLGTKYSIISAPIIFEINRRLNTNMLKPFLNAFPNVNRDYNKLSQNPNITMADVLANPTKNGIIIG